MRRARKVALDGVSLFRVLNLINQIVMKLSTKLGGKMPTNDIKKDKTAFGEILSNWVITAQ